MNPLKNKYFLPICAAGVLAGYGAAEYLMPRYFNPTENVKITTVDLLTALGSQKSYYKQTPSGNYLAGQFAQNHKDWEKASDFIGRVLETDKKNTDLQKHAMVLAMASGQVNQAIALAKEILKNPQEGSDTLLATLFVALGDFANEDYASVTKTLEAIEANTLASFIVPALELWADTAQGKLDLEKLDQNPFYAYHAMLAANYLNKGYAATEYALKAFNIQQSDVRDIEKTADLFAKVGETDKALKLYKAMSDKGFSSPDIAKKITYLDKDISINDIIKIQGVKTPKDGAALVFLDMGEILLREYSDDSATIFSQMALFLNPQLDDAHMIIGNVLVRHDRDNQAIIQYKKIKQSSEFYVSAQRQIAELYAEQDKPDEAIAILNKLYETDKDIDALIQVGDIYRYQEEFKKSVNAYNKVVNLWDEIPEEYWHVLYARGMAYERLKQFKKSEEDLQRALDFRPNHPYLLNYLGYSWADQGINLNRSLKMIKEATLAKPEDGYIADSLGWVYFKMFEFDSAVVHLERAVELLPYDATINDHLGDAYWRAGRKLEAKFQWQRAKNNSEEDEAELKQKIEDKIANGLPDLSKKDKKEVMGIAQENQNKEK